MKRTPLDSHPCSIARALDVAGEWWTPLILRDIAYGVRRFKDIQDDLGISANVLSDRLEALVSGGLLEQRAYQDRPRRHEYHLTEMGADLIPALLALMRWGDRWRWPDGRGPVRVLHGDCGHEVSVEVRCEECGREVAVDEIRATLRVPSEGAPVPEGAPGHVSGARLASDRDGIALEL